MKKLLIASLVAFWLSTTAAFIYSYDVEMEYEPEITLLSIVESYGYSPIMIPENVYFCRETGDTTVKCIVVPPMSILLIPQPNFAPMDTLSPKESTVEDDDINN